MSRPTDARLDLGDLLQAVEDAPPVAAAEVVGRHLAEAVGASDVAFLIADFNGRALIRLGPSGADGDADRATGSTGAERVPLADTVHGRVLATQSPEVTNAEDGVHVVAPVTNRGEAIGVLELRLAEAPDAQALALVRLTAHALAYVVIANRRYTDLFEWGQRSVPLSLAAEIQHRILPGSYTCEAGQFTLAGWLEPAGNIAGDTFDFSLERDTVHLSLTDAMGHDVQAAMLATVVVSSLRNARRTGADVAGQAAAANAALSDYAAAGEFATGQLVRIDLPSGSAEVVNAGHPCPLRLRDGRVDVVPLLPDPPFGVVPGRVYRVHDLPLQAGDRLFFLTDGVLERSAGDLDVRGLVAASAGRHPREAVQHLLAAAREAAGGELQDDATAMCLDWHGGRNRERRTSSGSDR